MTADEVRARILEALPGAEVEVVDTTGTRDHFEARVVSERFSGKTLVQQHQMVYAPLQPWLKTGELHALALRTSAPKK